MQQISLILQEIPDLNFDSPGKVLANVNLFRQPERLVASPAGWLRLRLSRCDRRNYCLDLHSSADGSLLAIKLGQLNFLILNVSTAV